MIHIALIRDFTKNIRHDERGIEAELKNLKILFTQDFAREDYMERNFMNQQHKKILKPRCFYKEKRPGGDVTLTYEEFKKEENLYHTSLEHNSESSSSNPSSQTITATSELDKESKF
ncbi:hypothetical protein JTB14_037651 [Gonioctena quinquepunctata]|nr:hypothetical protein JTB14_037651 [Gonioctena quinquepunctata]